MVYCWHMGENENRLSANGVGVVGWACCSGMMPGSVYNNGLLFMLFGFLGFFVFSRRFRVVVAVYKKQIPNNNNNNNKIIVYDDRDRPLYTTSTLLLPLIYFIISIASLLFIFFCFPLSSLSPPLSFLHTYII